MKENTNNKNTLRLNSIIFIKKINNKHKIIPLKTTNNTLGPTKYFPTAIKEWSNGIYSFNKNVVKLLSIKGKNLNKIIRSYFNFYFNKNLLNSKYISTRFKRLSINKIFVSKAELKHTSSKVVINLYIYNEERRNLMRRIKRLESLLFPSHDLLPRDFKDDKLLSIQGKLKIINDKSHTMYLEEWLSKIQFIIKEELELKRDYFFNILNIKDFGSPLWKQTNRIIEDLETTLNNIRNINRYCKYNAVFNYRFKKAYIEFLQLRELEKEIMTISYYNLILNLNSFKFENDSLLKIKAMVGKIYKKKVEFNIVNLKTLYLNSDIFTQAISIKLKNRDNKLLDVLRYSLHMVKLSRISRVGEKYNNNINIKNLWVNKVKAINTWIPKEGKDALNILLFDLYSKDSFTKFRDISINETSNNSLSCNLNNVKDKLKYVSSKILSDNKSNDNLVNFVFKDLKNKQMAGVRLEAKGRLTRRFTASRSIFKIKWKGTLKNIDSSYKGLSTVMLRGHVKSNVQYSTINSKNRNGAYGLKGWISSK